MLHSSSIVMCERINNTFLHSEKPTRFIFMIDKGKKIMIK
jgi:hypothetical protein